MLLLSNAGEHPPVLVGDAQQIKHGPALAGLDISNKQGFERAWLQTIVVPDGVTRVVMKFTPPFLHHYSNAVAIRSNVGIVVRRPDYTPTTVLWYGANGKLLRKFVDRKQIAADNCLAAHKKTCESLFLAKPGHGIPAPVYRIATNQKQSGSHTLLSQADALYKPVQAYQSSVTAAQDNRARAAKASFTKQLNACDAPYGHQLFMVKAGTEKQKLYMLWADASGMQNQEVRRRRLLAATRELTSSWAALSVNNKTIAASRERSPLEIDASLDAPRMNTCAFVRAIAAHHFSYQWARHSAIRHRGFRLVEADVEGQQPGFALLEVRRPTNPLREHL